MPVLSDYLFILTAAYLFNKMPTETSEIETLANREYRWGFVTDIESDSDGRRGGLEGSYRRTLRERTGNCDRQSPAFR